MADFVPSQKYASDFNKAKKYENGDAVQAETVNNLIEGQLFVQGIATNQPRVEEDNTEGQPIVYFENKDGLPRFVFRNIKGKDGKGEKGDNGNIMRFTDSALYARSDAGTTLSISSRNLINYENVASGDVVLDTHFQEGENYYICIWLVTEVNVGATGTTVFLRGMDYIPSTGGGTVKIEVDKELSTKSENPVQNKAIALALGELEDNIKTNANHISKEILRATTAEEALSKDIRGVEETLSEDISSVNALAQNNQGSIRALNTKVQEINGAYVDADEVKGFINEALNNFSGDITVDMELSDTSTHPIANKVVTEALKGKLDVGGTLNSGKVLVTDQNGKILSSGVDANKLNFIQGLTAGAQAQIDNINTAIGNLDTKVDGIDGVVDGHTLSLNGLKSRLNTVEADVDARAKTIEYSWESVGINGVNPFKLNLTLKDANGTQLSTTQIDFPLEQMVVGAEYDKDTKDLILYTTDGQVAIPVDDIFDGLVTDSNIGDKTAGKAKVLETAQKITFKGDVTGEYTFDGSSGKIVTLTVADDSHNHVISNVDGLQTALDSKLDKSGGTMTGEITIGQGDGNGIQLGKSGYINATANDGSEKNCTLLGVNASQGYALFGHPKFYMQMRGSNAAPTYNGNTVIHSGNYSSYALPLTGGTISGDITANNLYSKGNIEGYMEAVQGGDGGYLRIDRIDNEVNLENTTNHCILLGKPYRDKIEFYEYGGEFNFYKSQHNVNTLLLHIHPNAFQYKGQNVIHSGNFETYMQNYLNTYILEKGY